jgi:FKBP-type peptidyl-prolyl cis-trans isomerase
VPVSRQRKVQKARKRPRVPHSAATPTPLRPTTNKTNQRLRIGAVIVLIVLAASVVAFLVSRGGRPATAEITTPSGLRILDLKVGDGPSPKMGETVSVHYIGWLENGTEFNNSHKGLGKPIDFKLGEVIEGWNEGLSSMKVGGKRKLLIPSKLAYGPQGRPPNIPPNSNLIFEVELLGIK